MITVTTSEDIMPESKTFYISVLFFKSGDLWVAQCLEYDIVAQGSNLSNVTRSFEHTFIGQIILDIQQGKEPLYGFGQAPPKYWEKFDIGELLTERKSFSIKQEDPLGYIIVVQDRRIFT